MTKKQFNLLASVILFISLIYVPTIVSDGELTGTADWAFLFDLNVSQFVDLVRLTIEELAIGVFLYGLWQFVSED